MCMGGGGGSVPKAKINKHMKEREAARADLDKIIGAINRVTAKDVPLTLAQNQLDASNKMLSGVLDQAGRLQEAAANSQAMVSQNAAQMAALVGPPPPEKSATKVVVGKARGVDTESDRNRRSLRIDLNTST
jgi:non-ribosomal peptide synthetase component F